MPKEEKLQDEESKILFEIFSQKAGKMFRDIEKEKDESLKILHETKQHIKTLLSENEQHKAHHDEVVAKIKQEQGNHAALEQKTVEANNKLKEVQDKISFHKDELLAAIAAKSAAVQEHAAVIVDHKMQVAEQKKTAADELKNLESQILDSTDKAKKAAKIFIDQEKSKTDLEQEIALIQKKKSDLESTILELRPKLGALLNVQEANSKSVEDAKASLADIQKKKDAVLAEINASSLELDALKHNKEICKMELLSLIESGKNIGGVDEKTKLELMCKEGERVVTTYRSSNPGHPSYRIA